MRSWRTKVPILQRARLTIGRDLTPTGLVYYRAITLRVDRRIEIGAEHPSVPNAHWIGTSNNLEDNRLRS